MLLYLTKSYALQIDYKRDGVIVLSTHLVQNENGIGTQATKSVQKCAGLACGSITTTEDSILNFSIEQVTFY